MFLTEVYMCFVINAFILRILLDVPVCSFFFCSHGSFSSGQFRVNEYLFGLYLNALLCSFFFFFAHSAFCCVCAFTLLDTGKFDFIPVLHLHAPVYRNGAHGSFASIDCLYVFALRFGEGGGQDMGQPFSSWVVLFCFLLLCESLCLTALYARVGLWVLSPV